MNPEITNKTGKRRTLPDAAKPYGPAEEATMSDSPENDSEGHMTIEDAYRLKQSIDKSIT
jgi:hypothetical protein